MADLLVAEILASEVRSGHDPKKNDPPIIFDLKKMIRDPNHFFNPLSVIRIFFSIIRTSSDQFISHVMFSYKKIDLNQFFVEYW